MKKIIFLVNIVTITFFMINLKIEATTNIVQAHEYQIPSLASMLEHVMPSVVSISVEGSSILRFSKNPQQFQPFFGYNSPFCQDGSPFQGSPMCPGSDDFESENHQKFHVLGSGVILDSDKGYVVTNNHVVENGTKIQVQTIDGKKYNAQIIGNDPLSDIALIQIKNFKFLTAIKLADSDLLRVGDYTVAIGNPYGIGETVTSGIISALGRSGLNLENYENFIQTDAAINRGNSGGALINLKGELIGINTAILAPDGGNIGIGFAIPSNMVKSLTLQMAQYGQVRRGEIGIMGIELNSELAKALKVDTQKGAFVSQVMPNSSAAKAGIKSGDIIISINKKSINSFLSLRAQIATLPIGSKMELGGLRDNQYMNFIVELQEIKKNNNCNTSLIEGAELINYEDKNYIGIKVNKVKSNSLASHIDLRVNDIILSVNQKRTKNLIDLKKVFEEHPGILVFNVQRGNQNIYLLMQ